MNREQAKQLLPIIQAYAEGKAVQARYSQLHDAWTTQDEILPPHHCEYRIKPEPTLRAWTTYSAPRVFAARNKVSGHYMLIDHGKDWHTGDAVIWSVLSATFDRVMEDGTLAPCGTLEEPK